MADDRQDHQTKKNLDILPSLSVDIEPFLPSHLQIRRAASALYVNAGELLPPPLTRTLLLTPF